MTIKKPRVIVRPTVEPISLAEAREHLRLDAYDSPAVHPDDALVAALITAARQWSEQFLGRAIAVQTLEIGRDQFPGRTNFCNPCSWFAPDAIDLPGFLTMLAFTSDDEAVTDYQLDRQSDPPCLRPAAGTCWPTIAVRGTANAVKVRYVAGYTLPGDSPDLDPLPGPVRSGMLLLLGHLYENREDTAPIKIESVPMGVDALLRPYRLHTAIA